MKRFGHPDAGGVRGRSWKGQALTLEAVERKRCAISLRVSKVIRPPGLAAVSGDRQGDHPVQFEEDRGASSNTGLSPITPAQRPHRPATTTGDAGLGSRGGIPAPR